MFQDTMSSFLGKMIKIDQGCQEYGVGRLLDVFDDYLVVQTEEDGVVFYITQHIQSVTENTKEFNILFPEGFEYKKANNLLNLLESQKLNWVKLNRDSQVNLEGVLYDVNNDMISLIHNEEIVYISFSHLHNISIG
ncbi:hypothetical protein BIV60_08200 [Bacillus sp. MUM 116]|uniref:hypothetical protein n=1 Tax=Bacillus sp. MUM 116 TaxID=1678002 RepID=UPI0008F57F02|nr:hypothetical protein [Bacillus sp. MUM 116]OIK15725.1 hypothetical protein BIV60_08200 [Bacillus sp. MUM 116]